MADYSQGIANILNAYDSMDQRIAAIQVLIATAEENQQRALVDEMAAEVCEGLHLGKAKGLKCRKCYNAEQNFNEEAKVEAEFAAAKERTE
jgi:hypothetical protein